MFDEYEPESSDKYELKEVLDLRDIPLANDPEENRSRWPRPSILFNPTMSKAAGFGLNHTKTDDFGLKNAAFDLD